MCDHLCVSVCVYTFRCTCMYWCVLMFHLTKYLLLRLYDEAMKKGYVEISVTKCLVLGAAGVGKTHLKHLLLKKDPPEHRVSTGLADNPVRAISLSRVDVGGGTHNSDNLIVIEEDQILLSIIGGTIKGRVSKASSMADMISTLPTMAVNNAHSDLIPAGVNTMKNTSIQQIRTAVIEDELIHHIQQSGK